jgi:double zinc ribbon protein
MEGVKMRLASFANGEQLSLFTNGHEDPSKIPNENSVAKMRMCKDCGFQSHSLMATYCERCGKSLNVKCDKCGKMVLASFDFCNGCGTRLSF